MPVPRVRHIAGLCVLVLLVAYFGVWAGYETVSLQFGPAWGMAAALLAAAGLVVIAVVGVVVIRTMRAMEPGGEVEEKRAKNQSR